MIVALSHRVETLCWNVLHRWCVGGGVIVALSLIRLKPYGGRLGTVGAWGVGMIVDLSLMGLKPYGGGFCTVGAWGVGMIMALPHRVETLWWRVLYRWCIGGRRDSANGTLSANVGSNPTDIYAHVSIDRRAPTVRYQIM